MKTQVVVVAAGKGERLKVGCSKGLVLLGGRPLFLHSLATLSGLAETASCIVTAPSAEIASFEQAVTRAPLSKPVRVIPGGETRQQSVRLALQALDEDTQTVIVHDGARPLLTRETARAALDAARDHAAVIVAVPVTSTVKQVDAASLTVEQTLDRSKLWEVQTPQVFDKETLARAHALSGDGLATDDAVLAERMGVPVKVVVGDYSNIKITTPEDLDRAEKVMKRERHHDP